MVNKFRFFLVILLLSSTFRIFGQLSPGDLSKYHADLEGLLNCTQCHNLGEGISETKCLECHNELKSRIDQNKGYHSSLEVKQKACIECHNDHHGRNFEIVHFDENNFNHELTGYELEGKHGDTKCLDCHKKSFIDNPVVQQKEFTFLGLNTDCRKCHEDSHQGSLSNNCASCHGFDSFKPAEKFNHDNSKFALKGKHLEIDCIECHPIIQKNGKDFQEFKGIEFTSCSSCHDDAHQGAFGKNCSECHTEESWHYFKELGNFNHNKTHFPLTGRHRNTDCLDCHKNGTNNQSPFKEFTTWKTFDCAQCHDDVHEEKLGTDCKNCHSTQSFTRLNKENTFDHSKTDYALEGKHQMVDCNQCHTSNHKIEPLEFDRCNQCHDDFHKGQFTTSEGTLTDCGKCHTVKDFAETLYTLEDHNGSLFPLEGGHVATPCFACHLKEDNWTFRDIGQRCNDCHIDEHEGFLDPKFYPDKECKSCHTAQTWSAIQFDHDQTNFSLEGKHLSARCNDCHLLHGIDNEHQLFSGLTSRCMDCHDDIHAGQFLQDGLTDCSRCHSFENWEASRFNHNETRFRLDGEHSRVECAGCHKVRNLDEREYIDYKIEDFRCAACHL
ncbi:MAG: hypothetical protein KDC53_12145 [Saprospiraceae bacterium]|nr:hypothetical protein [Saprospiraceae bacterium]